MSSPPGGRVLPHALSAADADYIARTDGEPPCGGPWLADAAGANAAAAMATTTRISEVIRRIVSLLSGGVRAPGTVGGAANDPLTARQSLANERALCGCSDARWPR